MAPALSKTLIASLLGAALLAASSAQAGNYLALSDGSGGATLVELDPATGDLTPITLTQALGTITHMESVDDDTLVLLDSGNLPGSNPGCPDGQPNPGPDRPTSLVRVDIVTSQGNKVGIVTVLSQSDYFCLFDRNESDSISVVNLQDNGDVLFMERRTLEDFTHLRRYDAGTGQTTTVDLVDIFFFFVAVEPDLNMLLLDGGDLVRMTVFQNDETTLITGSGFSGRLQGRAVLEGDKLVLIESRFGTPGGALWEFDLTGLSGDSIPLDESTGPGGGDFVKNSQVFVDAMGEYVLATHESSGGVDRTLLRTIDMATGQIQLVHELAAVPPTITAAALTTVPEPNGAVVALLTLALVLRNGAIKRAA